MPVGWLGPIRGPVERLNQHQTANCCIPCCVNSVCSVAAKAAVNSADGTKLAAVTEEGVDVYTTATGSKVRSSGLQRLLSGFLPHTCCCSSALQILSCRSRACSRPACRLIALRSVRCTATAGDATAALPPYPTLCRSFRKTGSCGVLCPAGVQPCSCWCAAAGLEQDRCLYHNSTAARQGTRRPAGQEHQGADTASPAEEPRSTVNPPVLQAAQCHLEAEVFAICVLWWWLC